MVASSWNRCPVRSKADARRPSRAAPEKGIFLTQDPIGLAGGTNLYAYAGNDPVGYSDPFGLCKDPNDPDCNTLDALLARAKAWASEKRDQLYGAIARVHAAINPMAGVVGALHSRDPGTGAPVAEGAAVAMGIMALVDLGNGPAPAIDIKAGRAALRVAMAGESRVMAGQGSKIVYRAAVDLGGEAGDWSYRTSTSVWSHQGHRYQAHWALNETTGATANAKLKYLGPE